MGSIKKEEITRHEKSYIIAFLIVIIIIWGLSFIFGFQKFDANNIPSILGSLIQGISAILGVSIAVIIFRIQTLENRKQSLEESTLNYIFNIIKFTYPAWGPVVEMHITKGVITEKYKEKQLKRYLRRNELTDECRKRIDEDKGNQQKRLEYVLEKRQNIGSTIRRMKSYFKKSTFLLAAPIIASLIMLVLQDILPPLVNYMIISISILLSAIGILVLIQTVLSSTRN